jgi:hypothetical protein
MMATNAFICEILFVRLTVHFYPVDSIMGNTQRSATCAMMVPTCSAE